MIPYFELKRVATELTTRCECILFGSLGLQMAYPQVLPDAPHDVDLFAAGNRDNLVQIITLLRDNGYLVYSWQDPIVAGFDWEILRGRFYFRGVKKILGYEPAIIDVTYEIAGLQYEELDVLTQKVEGIKTLTKDGFICALDRCEKEKHLLECEMLKRL